MAAGVRIPRIAWTIPKLPEQDEGSIDATVSEGSGTESGMGQEDSEVSVQSASLAFR
jgi:hypothetical protein